MGADVELCPGAPITGSGSISDTALGCLLTPASDSDRSIRAVGPQIEIGARARQIDGSRTSRSDPSS
jgi:hypothetical protein